MYASSSGVRFSVTFLKAAMFSSVSADFPFFKIPSKLLRQMMIAFCTLSLTWGSGEVDKATTLNLYLG